MHSGPSWRFLFIILNFALLVSILVYFLKQRARDQFKKRADEIRSSIEQAKKLHDKTRWHLEEMKTKLEHAEAEAQTLVQGVQKQAELEKKDLLQEAREITQRLSLDIKRITDQEIEQARQELKTEALRLATDLAAKKIEQEMTAEKHHQLEQEFTKKLQ